MSRVLDKSKAGSSGGVADDFDWAAITADYGALLLGVAHSITGSWDEAQDIVQVTLETAWRHRHSIRDRGAMRAWLVKITAREAIRWSRQARARFARGPQPVTEIAVDPRLEERLALRQAIRSLPQKTRAALVLHYAIGLSIQETAACLGTSPNTVKTQLRVASERVREELR